MPCFVRAAALVLTWTTVLCTSVLGEEEKSAPLTPWDPKTSDLKNPQIDIAYVEPNNPAFRPIYERVKKRQVLEELQAFLAPLRLPKTLSVKIDQCGTSSLDYEPGGPVIICYEFIAMIERVAPASSVPIGPGLRTKANPGVLKREDAIAGAFVSSVLTQVAHAVFDILEVPVWGREDDAADYVASFITLQFGKDVAWKTLIGTAWFLSQIGIGGLGDFSYVHSVEGQRFYNYLCIAYGADPATFGFLLKTNLPTNRAETCAGEYANLRAAFGLTFLPHIDEELLKKVQATEWLKVDDAK